MSTVFISYRREITAGEARALFNELLEKLGKNSVFMDVDSIALGRDFRGALQKTLESCDLMLVLIGKDWADVKDEEGRPRLQNPGDFVRLEIEAALKRDIVVTPILVQGAHMPAPEQLPAEIRDLVYRNGFELSHNRWESDFAEMIRRLNLDIAEESTGVEQPASTVAAPDASVAPAAQPTIPGRQFFRVTRRQALGGAALTAAGAGAIIAAPSIRRFLSKPSLRNIAFDVATVDSKGVRNPPEKYTAAVFTEVLGSTAGLDMVSIPEGSFTMGSPVDEPERQGNEGPQHHVTLAPFFISASPVTQAQWSAAILAHPDQIRRNLDPNSSFFKGIDLPVESITWNQAEEFCLRLTAITGRAYRLPSEAEWEYACRAGTMGPFISGRPSPPSWRTIVEPAVRYAAKATARASPPTSMADRGINRAPMVRAPLASSEAKRRLRAHSHRTGLVSPTCTAMFGSIAWTSRAPTIPIYPSMAAPTSRAPMTARGYCAAARGRTTLPFAALPTATALPPTSQAGRVASASDWSAQCRASDGMMRCRPGCLSTILLN
jgi:formylglycine-generating enzyme required for sulfatase activity